MAGGDVGGSRRRDSWHRFGIAELPPTAAWRHREARDGFEVLFLRPGSDGYRFEGHATALEADTTWSIHYTIELDRGWATRSAQVIGHSAGGEAGLRLEADGAGSWRVNGEPAAELDGCLDVDLEASAFTNAFPVRRLGLDVGEAAEAPAAWVRAPTLEVTRLEQRYVRLEDDGDRWRYDYAAPELDFTTVLVYDPFGLVLDYPGLAVRAA